jgi:hypothetical protein
MAKAKKEDVRIISVVITPSTTLPVWRADMIKSGFNEKFVDDMISSTRGFLDACAHMGLVGGELETYMKLFYQIELLVFEDEQRKALNYEGRWKR